MGAQKSRVVIYTAGDSGGFSCCGADNYGGGAAGGEPDVSAYHG